MGFVIGKGFIGSTETLFGTDSDETLDTRGGGDILDGGRGRDVAAMFDNQEYFQVLTIAGITHVRSMPGANAQYFDTPTGQGAAPNEDAVLIRVKSVAFTDGSQSLDQGPNTSFILGKSLTGSSEVLTGGDSSDSIDTRGGGDLVDGGRGSDIVAVFDSRDYFDVLTIAGITHVRAFADASSQYYDPADPDAVLVRVEALAFTDASLTLASGPNSSYIIGRSFVNGAENLFGSDSGDTFDTRGGSDLVDGGRGSDILAIFDSKLYYNVLTIAGITHLRTEANASDQYLGASDTVAVRVETLAFTDGTQTLASGPNSSYVFGKSLVGTSETLYGTDFNDTFDTRGGSDLVDGGRGEDIVAVFDNKRFYDVLTIAGITHLRAQANAASEYVDATGPGADTVLIRAETLAFTDGTQALAKGPNSAFVIGSSFAGTTETLSGTDANETFDTRGGGDLVDGGRGTDILAVFDNKAFYEVLTIAGISHIRAMTGASDQYYDGAAVDAVAIRVETLAFTDGTTTLAQGSNGSFVIGKTFLGTSETLTGTDSADTIDTRGGSDLIDGGRGDDILAIFDAKGFYDVLTIAGITHVRTQAGASNQYLDTSGADTVAVRVETLAFSDGTRTLDQGTNSSFVIGKSFAGTTETLLGTDTKDSIDTRGGGDLVDGGRGDDVLAIFDNKQFYDVMTIAGITHVRAQASASSQYYVAFGPDAVAVRVETLAFVDGSQTLDQGPNSSFVIGKTFVGASEDVIGSDANDTFDTRGGGDLVDGARGDDILAIFDDKRFHEVITIAGITHIRAQADASNQYYNAAGADTVAVRVETLAFADGTQALAAGPNASYVIGSSFVGASETLVGSDSNDTFDTRGGADVIDGGRGTDILAVFDDKAYYDVLTIAGITHVRSDGNASDQYHAPGEYDTVAVRVETIAFADGSQGLDQGPNASFIIGKATSGTEFLFGTDSADSIDTLGGVDIVDGARGNDILAIFDNKRFYDVLTIAGITHVRAHDNASNQYDGGTVAVRVETLAFLDGTQALADGPNASYILGQTFAGASETLFGTDDNDTIDTLGGSDIVDGGRGADILAVFDNRAYHEVLTIAGITHIRAADDATIHYVGSHVVAVRVETVAFLDGTRTLDQGRNTSFIIGDTVTGSETLTGTDSDDSIDTRGGADFIDGGRGSDTLALFDSQNSFEIITLSGVTHIRALPEASDRYYTAGASDAVAIRVETIGFTDGEVRLSQGPNGSFVIGKSMIGTSETLIGTDTDDTIDTRGGGDYVDGGRGQDKVVIFDAMENFEIYEIEGVTHLRALSTASSEYYADPAGTGAAPNEDMVLVNVEFIQFTNATYAIVG